MASLVWYVFCGPLFNFIFLRPTELISCAQVETYATMHHGWMGARANLNNEENLKEYKRGYNQLVGFFEKHL